VKNELFLYFILPPFYQEYLIEKATGMTTKGIKASKLKENVNSPSPTP